MQTKKQAFYIFRLLTLKQEEWGDKVTVVSSDMREWKAPEKVKTCFACVCTKNTSNDTLFVFIF